MVFSGYGVQLRIGRWFINFIWIMILPTSQTLLLTKPYHSLHKRQQSKNMFEQHEESNHRPFKKEGHMLPNIYHFVGPQSLRQQVLEENYPHTARKEQTLQQMEDRIQIREISNSMLTGSGKQSTARYSMVQIKEFTKQYRNMQNFKEYQSRWEKQSTRIKRESKDRKQPTLLERSKKNLVVMINPEKEEILKNYVTSYWEMSLRNNNKILKRHLQGNTRYDESQLEQLLQRDEGVKEIESSVPKLPIQQLNKLGDRQLILNGHNKLASESASCDPSMISEWSSRRSRVMSELPPLRQSQVYRMEYDLAHRNRKDLVVE